MESNVLPRIIEKARHYCLHTPNGKKYIKEKVNEMFQTSMAECQSMLYRGTFNIEGCIWQAINEVTGVRLGGNVQLTGDGTVLQITMTETQRIESLVLSGTSGGNAVPLNLSVAEDAFSDLAGNKIVPIDIVLEEFPDAHFSPS